MARRSISFIATLTFTLLLLAGGSAIGQTTKLPLPQPTGYVNDYAGVIDGVTRDRLETTLGNLDRQQHIQFAVVTVDTTGGQDIFDYSLAVARGWGIGSKDTSKPSLLLLVAIKDRKYFTQVSRHLEGHNSCTGGDRCAGPLRWKDQFVDIATHRVLYDGDHLDCPACDPGQRWPWRS